MDFILNPQLELAFQYVRYTNKNIFLTGKAGTGKTTFLHQIKTEGFKRMVVLAPTGVAAINAGGMTLHSFFQLPFGLNVPGVQREESGRGFNRQKINLIRSLDLLVIDEISMVRADMLDAVDEKLRRYRDYSRPFGGVQLLMIGDLHQLPPVLKEEEWRVLSQHYQTPYFFGSLALRQSNPVTIELKHIYRQSDATFIELLNKVRDNHLDASVLQTLNSRYDANFQPEEGDGYITLTSHNAAAHNINTEKLALIPEPLHQFKAEIKGEFPQIAFPTEETLEFKVGAQVMFVKNDSPEKRFFNGKIGVITRIDGGLIYVRSKDEKEDICVSQAEWKNVRYTLEEKTKTVKEDEIGNFKQYPLKLAWAITIHKSQGLTFERAIIDAQAAFAHGQVYVALSRCKRFEGIVLRSKIQFSSVKTDGVVKTYSEEAGRNAPDEAHLHQSKRAYQQDLLLEMFSFKQLRHHLDKLIRLFLEHPAALNQDGVQHFQAICTKASEEVFTVADKFSPHLRLYFSQTEMPEEHSELQERAKKAGAYFTEKLKNVLLPQLKNLRLASDDKAILKSFNEYLENMEKEIFVKNACFAACQSAFSTHAYVQAKSNADLDFANSRTAATAAPSGAPKGTAHPELYARLLQWRTRTAMDNEAELWEILPTRSLSELVQQLPTTAAGLKKISGIGEAKVKRFGASILEIIEKYCAGKNITVQLTMPAEAEREPKVNTKQTSFDLFKSGKTLDEIAAERKLTRTTVETHLSHYIGTGDLDVLDLVPQEKVEDITRYFMEHGTVSLSAAKAHFGEAHTYGEIRLVLEHVKTNGVES